MLIGSLASTWTPGTDHGHDAYHDDDDDDDDCDDGHCNDDHDNFKSQVFVSFFEGFPNLYDQRQHDVDHNGNDHLGNDHHDNDHHGNDDQDNDNLDQDDSCRILGREREAVVSTNWEIVRQQFFSCSSGTGAHHYDDHDDDLNDDNVDDDGDDDNGCSVLLL